MFGQISNWINTNLPQVPQVNMPSMPAMPNMPNISMPTMPNMPNISMPTLNMPAMPSLFNKNKEEGGEQDPAKTEAAITSGDEAQKAETVSALAAAAADGQTNVDAIQVEPQAGVVANGAAAADGEHKKFNPLDLDPSKALGTAKDLGSNLGSKLL